MILRKLSMSKINKIFSIDLFHSLLFRSCVVVDRSSVLKIPMRVKCSKSSFFALGTSKIIIEGGKKQKLRNCSIRVSDNSSVIIHKNVRLLNVSINVAGGGRVEIFEDSMVAGFGNKISWIINNGSFILGHHSRVSHNMWIRYGGTVSVGNYSCINSGSEIRCDEQIKIGSYNQISFNVSIWDTNTHCIYLTDERRRLTGKHGIGYEYERPKTKPVLIGDDCWIGKNSSILKGTIIEDKCIVGYGTTLINVCIMKNTTVVNNNELKTFKNNI